MTWIANQHFSKASRRFIVNTNLSSRCWFVRWRSNDDEDDDDYDNAGEISAEKQRKTLSYTPSFGTHTFFYRGRLLLFRRSRDRENQGFLMASESEEISLSCFGRSPWILKELLLEAKVGYMARDSKKTLIYRGTSKSGTTEPTWQRCLARNSRPFSTVILDEKRKQEFIDDVADYLNPATRRWYANRGIPYRRGYLLYGPPGTGKSSISLALAGHFKMRIYIVSLSSITASEENLATLFAELPRRCVVLLEDIDTAGLTHTREDTAAAPVESSSSSGKSGGKRRGRRSREGSEPQPIGRLSLSGLLNILDGVASQEGRILIMTTNHIEKLDKALIRPGRVDLMLEFGRASREICVSIFKAIFATLEADFVTKPDDPNEQKAEKEAKKAEEQAGVDTMAHEFAAHIPEHEFSPAEIQGFLLKHKRAPAEAVAKASEFVVELRKQKKEAELKEAEKKRQEEAEKAKKKAEEERTKEGEESNEKKEKVQEAAKKLSKNKKRRKAVKEDSEPNRSDSESGSGSGSGSDSESGSGSDSDSEGRSSGTESSVAEPRTPGDLTPAVAFDSKDAEAHADLAPQLLEVEA